MHSSSKVDEINIMAPSTIALQQYSAVILLGLDAPLCLLGVLPCPECLVVRRLNAPAHRERNWRADTRFAAGQISYADIV